MRNPLMSLQRNTSKEEITHPVPEEPVLEEYAGVNHPYRGIEEHGVPDVVQAYTSPRSTVERGTNMVSEPLPPEPNPVPVRIVQSGGRERRMSRFYREFATAIRPRSVVGADEQRTKVTVKNLGAEDVYIGHDSGSATAMMGWPLAQNGTIESSTQDELWAMSSHATDDMQLSVHVEYSVNL